MTRYFRVSLIMLVISLSCTRGISKNDVTSNEKIDAKLRDAIHVINKQVFGYMQNNTYEPLSQLFTDTLAAHISPDFAGKFMPQIRKVLVDRSFKVFDEYYVRQVKEGDSIKFDGGKGDNAYTIKLYDGKKETYISMLQVGDSLNEVIITLVLNKVHDKWKISMITGEDYTLNKMNAIGQYKKARSLQQQGDLIDAANVMSLATHCLAPGGNLLQYKLNDQILKYNDSLTTITKVQYSFPYVIKEVPGKLTVFNIHYEVYDHQFTPMIMYTTSVFVGDTVLLKAENMLVRKELGNIFKGMDINNNIVLYRVYNEEPNERNNTKYYGFIHHLK